MKSFVKVSVMSFGEELRCRVLVKSCGVELVKSSMNSFGEVFM